MHISQFSKSIIFALIACYPLPMWAQTTTIIERSVPASTAPMSPSPESSNSNLRPFSQINGGVPTLSVGESQSTFRYTLGAGDSIKIDVFNVPELSGNQAIAPDGTINISLIGAVKLEDWDLMKLMLYCVKDLAHFSCVILSMYLYCLLVL